MSTITKKDYQSLTSKMSFGVDWLNGHLDYDNVLKFFSKLKSISPKLDISRWVLSNRGLYNYSRCYMLDGHPHIQIAYNPLSDTDFLTAQTSNNTNLPFGNFGIFITLSGSGMRYLENLSPDKNCLNELMYLFYRLGFKATRFDCYLDCFDSSIAPLKSIREAFKYFYQPQVGKCTLSTNFTRNVSASKDKQNVKIYRNVSCDNKVYYNYQLGGHGSNTGMFRCYNKYDEQKANLPAEGFYQLQQQYGFNDFWYRFEYEVHGERANQAFQACMASYEEDNKKFGYAGLWLSCSLMFFKIVIPKTWGCKIAQCPDEQSWIAFQNIVQSIIHFVELSGGVFSFPSIPYIRKNLLKFERHKERTAWQFAKAQVLSMLDPEKDRLQKIAALKSKAGTAEYYLFIEDVSSLYNVEPYQVELLFAQITA